MLLKILLKENKQVIIILNENNRKEFLNQAKKEGFKWSNKKNIQTNDECFFHMLINKDGYIKNVSTMCYIKSKELQFLPVYTY